MESTRANELGHDNSVEACDVESVIIVRSSICKDVRYHEDTHGYLDCGDACVLDQISSDEFILDFIGLLASVVDHHDDHFSEAMVEMNL